tara:strand:+ start:376 stop:1605 length:1230 start_codon:yes stop_codon:yes gene_type:complete
MAITDKEQGVWDVDQVYNKINQGGIWKYNGAAGEPGGVWQWYYDNYGRLGINEEPTTPNTYYSSPVMANGTFDDSWGQTITTFARGNDGSLWAWGYNGMGLLGQNDTASRSVPVQIGTDTDWAKNGSIGRWVKTNGAMYVCGPNSDGALGLNMHYGSGEVTSSTGKSSPVQLGTETTWAQSEYSHSKLFSLKTDGTAWYWGGWSFGCAGNGTTSGTRSSPTQLAGYTFASMGNCGAPTTHHYGGVTPTGSLYMWGANASGQLGLNEGPYRAPWQPNWGRTNRDKSTPNSVPGTTWKYMQNGLSTTLASKTDGTLWAWGYGAPGGLGLNSTGQYSSPTQIGTDTTWTGKIFQSGYRSAAVKTDGSIWVWGANSYGGLGVNDNTSYSSPIQLPGSWTDMGDGYYMNLIKAG